MNPGTTGDCGIVGPQKEKKRSPKIPKVCFLRGLLVIDFLVGSISVVYSGYFLSTWMSQRLLRSSGHSGNDGAADIGVWARRKCRCLPPCTSCVEGKPPPGGLFRLVAPMSSR